MTRRFAAFALAIPISAAGALPLADFRRAEAGTSAYREGAEAMGAFPAGENCPIEVERETLTIDIPELPDPAFTAESFPAYSAGVTAHYTFFNPTAEDETVPILFPFGDAPDYAPPEYDFYGDTAARAVKENGAAVAVRSRYSYYPNRYRYVGSGFDVDSGVSLLAGAREAFFKQDTPVTVHTFRVEAGLARGAEKKWVFLEINLQADVSRTRIATSSEWASKCVENGNGVIVYGFDPAAVPFDFTVYAFGDDAARISATLYENRTTGVLWQGGRVEERETAHALYADFVAERYPGGALGEEDWYNGFTEAMESSVSYRLMCGVAPDRFSACDFMRWYEYDLHVPAHGSVENEVTAPIYPTIRGDAYDYTYLLSPASRWAAFGTIKIDIETPYYLTESSLDFEKREGGYSLEWENGLPLGELTFTLSRTESGENLSYEPFEGGISPAALSAILCASAAGVAGIAVAASLVVTRKKKSAAHRGETTEGKVDLPPKDDKKQ